MKERRKGDERRKEGVKEVKESKGRKEVKECAGRKETTGRIEGKGE